MSYETELAWAAGFFDGEGSICVRRDKRPGRRPGLLIDIEQVDPRPLERFKKAVGYKGKILLRPPRDQSRAIHRIAIPHSESVRTLAVLWPFLSEPKREQAESALAALGAVAA